jgi:hypothetical protein
MDRTVMDRKFGILTKEGMVWLSSETPLRASPQMQSTQSSNQEFFGSFPETDTAPTECGAEAAATIERQMADDQLFTEVLKLTESDSGVSVGKEDLRMIPWSPSQSSEFSVVCSGQQPVQNPADIWRSDQMDAPWNMSDDCGNMSENLTQSLQDSLDLLLTSQFFNTFSSAGEEIPNPTFDSITPEQQVSFFNNIAL